MVKNLYDCFLIAVLFVLSLVGGAWSACQDYTTTRFDSNCSGIQVPSTLGCMNTSSCSSLSYPGWCSGVVSCTYQGNGGNFCSSSVRVNSYSSVGYSLEVVTTVCTSQSSLDSINCLNAGNQWIDGSCCDEQCVCEKDGGQWDESTQSCQNCNDHVDVPDKCMEVWKNGYLTDADGNAGGGGYWAIETYECFYDSCSMSLNCQAKSSFPAGNLTCDDFQDTTSNNNCVAVIGSKCTIQCGNNVTINCDCDGSCQHAKTLAACNCPVSSSSQNESSSSGENPNSSDSQNESSSSGENLNSSGSNPNSSGSNLDSSGGDWEYDYRSVLDSIKRSNNDIAYNTNIAAGYLNSIDKWQSTINFNMREESGKIQSAISSGATQVANATNAVSDTLHRTNETLENINGALSSLNDTNGVPDFNISGWLDSANETIDALKNPDTTILNPDSLKNDTTQFKSKYSGFFLSNVYTRNGCYEFKMSKPDANSLFGRLFNRDIVVDFGKIADTFDMCAILRGLCRIAGAILVLLISIKSYSSAFSSGSGD